MTFQDLEHLEVIDACRNTLASVEPLKGLANLVTLKLDQNKLKSIDDLSFKKLTRLVTLSASHNEIKGLDEKISRLGALTSLNREPSSATQV
jgi:Leucine-rich repeat (LRR) protein